MTTGALADVFHPAAPAVQAPRASERLVAWLYGGTAVAVVALMGLAGLAMRFTQADVLGLSPTWFYRLLTLHGAGMLTGTLVGMMGGLWTVLRPSVPLSLARMLWSWASIAAGVVLVLVATLIGGFGTGWTFLYPLPFDSVGQWDTWATVFFLVGLTLVGVGFTIFCIDLFAKTTATYGGLARSLGIPYLRGREEEAPPPQAIAAVVVAIDGLLASAAGTTVVVAMLDKTIDGSTALDPLWAKNLTYFFGHSVANLIIYLAAGVVYVLLPRYTARPWKTTKPIVVGWLATLVFVATAYSHHLYLDFVQPRAAEYVSLTASVAASVPVAVVTAYTALMLIWGSWYRWTLSSSLLFIGFAGWTIGGAGALLDSLIPLNFRLHNTLWVVAHFHTYMLMCVVVWVLAFVAHLFETRAARPAAVGRARIAVAAMIVGGFGLVGAWYVSGALGVPRRYAVEPAGTAGYSLAGAVFGSIFAVGFLLVLLEFLALGRAAGWSGLPRLDAAREPTQEESAPVGRPFSSASALAILLGSTVVATASFFPQVTDAAESSARYHHLQHAGNFLFGILLGLAIAGVPAAGRLELRRFGLPVVLTIGAPTLMMLLMVPGIYSHLDGNPGLHATYHLAVAALGLLTAFGAAGLGRLPGRLMAALAVTMAVMYAAGVSGG